MNPLKPSQVVQELNKYIIGQDKAKRSVAIALRNRWRRQQLADEMRREELPEEFVETVLTGWWTTCLEVLPSKERRRGPF